jgi:hypothetical protein
MKEAASNISEVDDPILLLISDRGIALFNINAAGTAVHQLSMIAHVGLIVHHGSCN